MRRFYLLKVAICVMAVVSVTILNCGCEKENLEDLKQISNCANSKYAGVENVSSEMRNFDTYNDMKEEVSRLASMSIEELVEYENSIGYNSYGKVADNVYFSIFGDENRLEQMTRDDLLDLINANNDFVQIVNESDNTESAETKYYLSSFRYVMNRDCMFKVEDVVYKVFESGYVKCNETYCNILREMKENDFLALGNDDKIFHVFNYNVGVFLRETGNFGNIVTRDSVSIDNTERVKIWIEYDRAYQPSYGRLEVTTKGQHKTLGIFYDAKRHLTNNWTITLQLPGGLLQSFSDNTVTTNTVYKIYKEYATWFSYTGYIRQMTGYVQAPSAIYIFPN